MRRIEQALIGKTAHSVRRYACALALILLFGCANGTAPVNSLRLNFELKGGQPANDSLLPIFPNPFNRVAGDTNITIRFALEDSGSAQVEIQNALGDQVEIFSDSLLAPGYYAGSWNPLAADGTRLLDGLYFVTLRNGNFIYSRLVNLEANE